MRELGAVAAGHEITSRVGAEVLADGGNAIDAAVAAAFASCAVEPTLTGLGGAGFATIRCADGTAVCLDFFAAMPGLGGMPDDGLGPTPVEVDFSDSVQVFHVGPRSCAVPGFVAGVVHAHERFGSIPLARVLEPATELARGGVTITEEQAFCHQILKDILLRRPEGVARFGDPAGIGTVPRGAVVRQPDLAATFEAIAQHGASVMYTGELGAEIARWSADHDGLITQRDLADYCVREYAPVGGTWHGDELISTPAPSSGGALVTFALRVLDELRRRDHTGPIDPDTPSGARLVVAAMLAANGIRGRTFEHQLYGGGDLSTWIASSDVLAEGLGIADRILAGGAADEVARPSSRLGSTTHVSVIDSQGNAISMTTSTGCGSGEFAGQTGIHLNNMLGEDDLIPIGHRLHPGDRLTSMMAPMIAVRDGIPVVAIGSAGSNRLRSAILQGIVRVSDGRAPLADRVRAASHAGRIHPEAGVVHVEPDVSDEICDALEHDGHTLVRWSERSLYFGGLNAVGQEDESFAAAGDPRRGGAGTVAFEDGSISRH